MSERAWTWGEANPAKREMWDENLNGLVVGHGSWVHHPWKDDVRRR